MAGRRPAQIHLRHSPGLDGLRALAVTAVVLYHAGVPGLGGGFLGVDVFFVLSGFLITSLLLAEWRRRRTTRIDLLGFWKRRARRILPALYVLLLLVLGAWLVARPEQVAGIRKDALAGFAYVANWWFAFGSQPYFETGGRPSPFLHLWSLGVEEQYYLLWPLLFLLLARLRRWAAPVLLLGAAGSGVTAALLYRGGVDPSAVYYGTHTHASGLLIGSALAFVWTPGRRIRRGRRGSPYVRERVRHALTSRPFAEALGWTAVGGLVAAFVVLNQDSGLLYQGGMTIVAALTGIAVVAVTHPAGSRLATALEWGPVRWLGLRSYGIYLWHWPVLVLAGFEPALAPAAIAITLLLAELSYCFVELPVRRGGLAAVTGLFRAPTWRRPRVVPAGAAAALTGVLVLAAIAPPARPPGYLARVAVDTVFVQPVEAKGLPRPDRTALRPSASPSPAAAPSPAPTPDSVVAVGDSVMVGAAPALQQDIPGIQIDAREGRQVATGIDVLQQLAPSGRLDGAVVVDLGNNGTFTGDQVRALMQVLSSARLVVFVNLKEDEPWTAANNQVITTAVAQYPNAVLVNWLAASSPHPEYFWDDGLHLRPQGAAVYAQLIAAVIRARG